MIELRGRWNAAALTLAAVALAAVALTSTATLASPMLQGDGPMINGVETITLTPAATSSNDTQSNTDLSQAEAKPGVVNDGSTTAW